MEDGRNSVAAAVIVSVVRSSAAYTSVVVVLLLLLWCSLAMWNVWSRQLRSGQSNGG